LKTLIVEDEFTSRILLQNLLTPYGECHIAVSGEEAVEAFRMAVADAAPYDMICMDLRLPAMDGVEAVRQIREAEADNGVPWSNRVKIVMETSVDDLKNVMRSFHELCDAYLVKPIKKASLLDEMRKMGMTA